MNSITINYIPASTGSIEKYLLAAVAKTLEDHGAELSSVQFEECITSDPSVQKEILLFDFMTRRG